MNDKAYNLLFICTGNSARSILAEGLMTSPGRGCFQAYSAASHANGTVNPFALSTLMQLRIPVDNFRSKNRDEFAPPGAPALGFVFTVCDKAAGEVCPVWPGQPMTAHWGVPDPAAVGGTGEQKAKAFVGCWCRSQAAHRTDADTAAEVARRPVAAARDRPDQQERGVSR